MSTIVLTLFFQLRLCWKEGYTSKKCMYHKHDDISLKFLKYKKIFEISIVTFPALRIKSHGAHGIQRVWQMILVTNTHTNHYKNKCAQIKPPAAKLCTHYQSNKLYVLYLNKIKCSAGIIIWNWKIINIFYVGWCVLYP